MKLYPDGWLLFLEWKHPWEAVGILLLVNKLSIEELGQVGANILHVHQGKGLAKAGSLTNAEWNEREWVALLSCWSEEERVFSNPSLRKELVWSLPLVGSLGNLIEDDGDAVVLLEVVASHSHVLVDDNGVGLGGWASESQDFIDDT